jgi:hypothetical protein
MQTKTLTLNNNVVKCAQSLINIEDQVNSEQFNKDLLKLNKLVGLRDPDFSIRYFKNLDWTALPKKDRARCLGQFIHQIIAVECITNES